PRVWRPTSRKRHPAEPACAINTESHADGSRYGRSASTRTSVVAPINPLLQLSLHYVTHSQRNRDHRCASEVLLARRLFTRKRMVPLHEKTTAKGPPRDVGG